MLSLLLLVGLGTAHADDSPRPPEVRPVRRQVGDLAVEGALVRLGLGERPVRQLQAEWLPAMDAPKRSRSEGRELGWEFGVPRVWVTERNLTLDAVHKTEAAGTWRHSQPCAPLSTDTTSGPMRLWPVPPPVRTTQDPLGVNDHRRSLVIADAKDARVMMIGLRAGESATIVEITPKDGRHRGRGSRTRRRLSIEGGGTRIALREGEDERQMCVNIAPPPQTVHVRSDEPSLRQQVRELRERMEADRPGEDDGVAGPISEDH